MNVTDDNILKTGYLKYTAMVIDSKIGRDKFTEVKIMPAHHLSNIFVT